MACLDENRIAALLAGVLPPEEVAAIALHLDACAACHALAAEAARDEGTRSAAEGADVPRTLERGACVGRYVVLELVGAGGMGVVYAAYDPELDRRVALKLLRPAASGSEATAELRGRLLREAQALARLSHPNVVSVHDAGTFEDQVFIAMEYVAGRTLTAWLRASPRSRREIVEVFLLAGKGLAAAHAAGLVHRDFKPDNVLVGTDGRIRVTDFGVARVLAGPDAGLTEAREAAGAAPPDPGATASLVGTPAYMAPEQIEGRTADARTDLFSFCVALYEALYRERPFRGSSWEELRAAVLRGKVEDAPASARVPRWIRRVLLRGLHRSPEERWPSMEALLRALSRDPWRIPRIAAASAAAAAVAGALLFYLGREAGDRAERCRGAERKLAGVWDDSRKREVAIAFRATARPFAGDAWRSVERILDGYSDRWVAAHTDACEDTRVRAERSEEALELRVECLADRRQRLSATVDLLAHADAQVVEKATAIAGRLPDLEVCADVSGLRARRVPPKDAATAQRARELALELARIRPLGAAGKFREALAAASAATVNARALGYEPIEAEASLVLGELQVETGDFRAAEANLTGAFWSALATKNDEGAARAAAALVLLFGIRRGRYAAGQEWGHHAEAILHRLPEGTDLEVDLRTHLGVILRRQGRFGEAIAEHVRAQALLQRAGDERDPRWGTVLNNLAVVRLDQGKFEEGERFLRQALAAEEAVLGPAHPRTASMRANLGMVLLVRARYEEAAGHLRRALEIREQARGPAHPDVARSQVALGKLFFALGRYDEALAFGRRALSIYTRSLGAESAEVPITLEFIAFVLARKGKLDEAIAHAERAVALRHKKLGSKNPSTAWARSTLGEVYALAKRWTDAERELRAALEVLGAKRNPYGLGVTRRRLGEVLRGRGELEAAAGELRLAVAALETAVGAEHPDVAKALRALGETLRRARRARDAVAPLERALGIHERVPGDPRHLARTRFVLARALWESGGDRSRARALAMAARVALASPGARDPGGLARVDAWLARAGGSRR